jgi:hypothetical protein
VTVSGPEITVSGPGQNPGGLGLTINGSTFTLGGTGAGVLSDITITTIGPDGKPHTVHHTGGTDAPGKGFAIPGPDGKPLGLTVHKRPSRMEKVTYLGVSATEIPEILSKHLPVPSGIGLVIQEVTKDSPAEKAGLQRDDVLLRFEDQLLANAAQLRTLTRSKKPGDKVRLSVLQAGKETTLEAILGEREEDTANSGPGSWQPFWAKNGMPDWLPQIPDKALDQARGALEQARDAARRLMREGEALRGNAAGGNGSHAAEPPHPPGDPRDLQRRLDHLEEELGRLRADLNRASRENPDKQEPRPRRPHPGEGVEGREKRGEKTDPQRPPTAPKPEGN